MANLNFQQPPRSIANAALAGRTTGGFGGSSLAGHVTPTSGMFQTGKHVLAQRLSELPLTFVAHRLCQLLSRSGELRTGAAAAYQNQQHQQQSSNNSSSMLHHHQSQQQQQQQPQLSPNRNAQLSVGGPAISSGNRNANLFGQRQFVERRAMQGLGSGPMVSSTE